MSSLKSRVLSSIQMYLLYFFHVYFILEKHLIKRKKTKWIVGTEEIAGLIHYISQSISNAASVSLTHNKFYNYEYDYTINIDNKTKPYVLARIIYAPFLLAKLTHQSEGFFFIGAASFLIGETDVQEFEMKYIKKRKKKIIRFFTGSDIRSPKLSIEFAKKHHIELMASYFDLISPKYLTDDYENYLQNLVRVSEKYCDIIFNAAVDQISYFSKPTMPFLYFYPDERFCRNPEKFENISKIKVVHASSSPIIKGTQLVRAAVAKLKSENVDFEYIELIGVSNDVVLQELRSAHIVLNEFYALVPGLFGVEAMASYCALVTSADENYEKDLPQGSNNAWFVTRNYQVYDHLKILINDHELIKTYAEEGFKWAINNAAISATGKKLLETLSQLEEIPSQ